MSDIGPALDAAEGFLLWSLSGSLRCGHLSLSL